jgi:hexosaminidase
MNPVLLPRPRAVRLTGETTAPRTQARTRLGADLPAQGYRLTIARERISVQAADAAGAFHAQQTLRQLARQFGESLPCGEIEDFPDYPVRGVMLDISRDKMPTMETLFAIVEELAEWKINHLELYTEHTFAYRNHREVWEHASPMTADEIRRLDARCRERFIELTPNQNSFGHFERWLRHERYRPLAFDPAAPRCLNPANPGSLRLLEELYAELLPNFTSRKFNVGCDETQVSGEAYLEFLLRIHGLVGRYGRTMMFWGDIVVNHPELIGRLPRDLIALEWGYEAAHPFAERGERFARAGIPFYVCPGTSSWNSIAGRTDNCLANLRNAAVQGLACGAGGYLITDWGDNGHWQYLPVSWLGLAAGAAQAWCQRANRDLDVAGALDTHVFRDAAGVMGRLAFDLGNAYRRVGVLLPNSSALFVLLWRAADQFELDPGMAGALAETREYVRELTRPLADARMDRPDAEIVRAEFANAARMLIHACDRGLKLMGGGNVGRPTNAELAERMREILSEHRRLWLARNRPGGLDDSVRALDQRLREYEG